jgi:hypothetical protein
VATAAEVINYRERIRPPLLDALLDSWDRNNTILVNLLRALPEDGLGIRAMEKSPSIAQMFTHIHYVRLIFVYEDAPEFATEPPKEEWAVERDPARIAEMLNESAKTVRDAVKNKAEAGRDMDLHYDHPILLLQHMLLARGLPSRSDQTGAQDGGPSNSR